MADPSRNSLQYAREEIAWFADQANGDTLWQSLVGWAYYGPIMIASLLWWALTRLVGVPYAILCRLVDQLRKST